MHTEKNPAMGRMLSFSLHDELNSCLVWCRIMKRPINYSAHTNIDSIISTIHFLEKQKKSFASSHSTSKLNFCWFFFCDISMAIGNNVHVHEKHQTVNEAKWKERNWNRLIWRKNCWIGWMSDLNQKKRV